MIAHRRGGRRLVSHTDYSLDRCCAFGAVPRWDFESDVIIVGYGASGASAAIEAAGAGAKVVLFEVTAASGGTSALSGGEFYLGGGGGTPMQISAGFQDTTEDLFKYLAAVGGPNADLAKARLYADHSLRHFEWLRAQGIAFKNSYIAERTIEPTSDDCLIWSGSEEAYPFVNEAQPAPRGHCPKFVGMGGGRYVMDQLASRVSGLGVSVVYDARARALVADEEHRVQGLVVRKDGADKFARARRGIILCTGGFIMNRDMVKRHAPLLLRSRYPLGTVDDGSGIRLGESAGGAAVNMAEGFTTVPWYPPGSLVKGIIINERGQRFINEDCYHGRVSHRMLQQDGERIWLLADQGTYGVSDMHTLAKIEIGAAGNTWEEVERELKLPRDALTSSVRIYNHYAARGEDPMFHKAKKWLKPLDQPPFVALDCRKDHCFFSSFTLGGLDTLPTGEVLSEAREPIPGLFAAGRAACGLPRWGEGYSSGMSLADATFFGRQAGRRAATI
jgi:3-oxo-5alpha-steroid 4-dehydrogenase